MRCASRSRPFAIFCLLGMTLLLTACGQKGDLYLPDPAPQTHTKPSERNSAPRDSSAQDHGEGEAGTAPSQAPEATE